MRFCQEFSTESQSEKNCLHIFRESTITSLVYELLMQTQRVAVRGWNKDDSISWVASLFFQVYAHIYFKIIPCSCLMGFSLYVVYALMSFGEDI